MKKSVLILLQLLLTLTGFAQTFKYTSANLNVRSGPGTTYQVLTTIPSGISVEIAESCDCSWIKVYYAGEIGYVSSRFLTSKQSISSHTSTYQRGANNTIKYYTNSAGKKVQSPTYYRSVPAGATALCRDGTYSFSRNRRGTCSHHGGVARWLR